MILSTGLLLLSKEVLEDDAQNLLPGLGETLTPVKRFMALGDDEQETHSMKVFSTMRDWLLKGNLGVVKQCCQKVHLSSSLHVPGGESPDGYDKLIEALHKEGYHFMEVRQVRRRTHSLGRFDLQPIILPRQARDKHRKRVNLRGKGVFYSFM
jgi:hypothetical protein